MEKNVEHLFIINNVSRKKFPDKGSKELYIIDKYFLFIKKERATIVFF